MALLLTLHPDNPQPRLLRQAVQWLRDGGLLAVPTDSSYAVTARLDDKNAADAMRRLRGLDERHHLTLLCRDLAEIGLMAKVDNRQYRLLKAATPGPWTFILEATREVPRRVSHPSRKTIGIRVPEHKVALALLEEIGEPLLLLGDLDGGAAGGACFEQVEHQRADAEAILAVAGQTGIERNGHLHGGNGAARRTVSVAA